MPVLVMLVLSLILLPQNYGALVMPPSYTMLEIPDDPTLRGEIGDNVYEAYLLSISPQDADELVLLSFPVTQNPRYEMIWMIQRVPAEKFRNLRTVGRSDILAEDLPVQQLTTRLDVAKALARHCVGRFGGKLAGSTYEDAVTYLAEQMVIAPAEVPGFMSGQDVQVTAAELLRWTIVASVAEPKREELQSLMAENEPKALRDALERFGCKYNLFANYPEDNVKARLPLERRTAYLMMRRVGAIPQERLIADMVAAL
ncbi:hypothetical protein LLH23_02270 [bacterium]|nr:hypothetical protein [bacterium]